MAVPPVNEPRVAPGTILGGKYRVEKVLGAGGMGVVVAATHIALDQRVAVKYMLPSAFNDADMLARFQREARAAVKLKSEHVARVLDTGTFEDGSPYIVMEFLEGNDLAAELRRYGTLSPAVVAEYILHACDAVAEAHALGIVHRDLKPANLFLTRRHDGSPLVKVLDFGISKTSAFDDAALAMTSTASMLGSPLYMSPEQMRSSKHVDSRSDVWSVGVILYELLSGRVPFNASTLGDLLSQVMMDTHRPLSSVRSDVPPDLSALVDRCLVKDRNLRAQSVADIARALAPYVPPRALPLVERVVNVVGARAEVPRLTGAPTMPATSLSSAPPPATSLPGPVPGASAPTAIAANTAPTWSGTQAPAAPQRSRAGLLAVAGVLFVGFVGSGGVLAWGQWKSRAETKTAASAMASVEAEPVATAPAAVATVDATSVAAASQESASPDAGLSASAGPAPSSVATATATPRGTVTITSLTPAATASGKPIPRAVTTATAKPAGIPGAGTASHAGPAPPKPGILDTSK